MYVCTSVLPSISIDLQIWLLAQFRFICRRIVLLLAKLVLQHTQEGRRGQQGPQKRRLGVAGRELKRRLGYSAGQVQAAGGAETAFGVTWAGKFSRQEQRKWCLGAPGHPGGVVQPAGPWSS